jgi:cell division protein FtsI/penicillin-binding protein 2
MDHKEYKKTRDSQHENITKETKRDTIYGKLKNGDLVPLAVDQTKYKLVISPKDVPSFYEDRLYDLLNNIVALDYDSFKQRLSNKQDLHEEIKVINGLEREKVESLSIPGVMTYETFKREYPLQSVGGRVVGFVGGGEDGFTGRYGLEKQYNSDLTTKNNKNLNFFNKVFSHTKEDESVSSSKEIVTSLEPNVMKFINKTLLQMHASWQADEVSAIVMENSTGKIIAMETIPEFDPNTYKDFEIKTYNNPSIQSVYELGSIMKPITLSGAIEKNLIKPTTVFHDTGFVKIDNYTIKNFDEKVRGDQTMQDVISNSLNTGAVYVQKLLGKDGFKENYNKFGLNEPTEIDFPGEVMNKNDNLDTNTDVNFATASFGQGVAITPISMLTSLSIIANSGKKVCPHFLEYKLLKDRTKSFFECRHDLDQAVSSSTANIMKNMLVELVDSGLAKGKYKDENYKVGAKTGTAQLPSPDGKYYKDKFIHSYFMFLPGENPKYTVLIYQINPKKGALASLTLAPYATEIKNFLVTYYNIPPDR